MQKNIENGNVTIIEGLEFAVEMEKLDACEKFFLAGMVKAFILKKKIDLEKKF